MLQHRIDKRDRSDEVCFFVYSKLNSSPKKIEFFTQEDSCDAAGVLGDGTFWKIKEQRSFSGEVRSPPAQVRAFDLNLEYDKHTNATYWSNSTGDRDTLMAYDLKTDDWRKIEIEYYAAKEAADSMIL